MTEHLTVYSAEEFDALPQGAEEVDVFLYRASGATEGGLDDAAVARLAGLEALRGVELGEAYGLTDAGLGRLVDEHPGLRRLGLRNATGVTGGGLGAIGRLELEALDLWQLERVGSLSPLRGLPLRRVSVRKCKRLNPGALMGLGELRELEEVTLFQQQVDQELLGALATLPQLRRLKLVLCEIAPGAFNGLAGSPALEVLTPSRALSADEASTLSSLSTLRELDARVGGPEDLAALAPLSGRVPALNLGFIDIERVDDALITAVADALPDLARLDLSQGSMVGRGQKFTERAFVEVARLSKLRGLGLHRAGAFKNAALEPLEALQSLESLNLNGMHKLTAGVLKTVSALKGLRLLNLGDAPPTDASLKKLQQLPLLEGLSICRGQKVSDKGLIHLAGVPSLRRLQVYYYVGEIGDAGVEALSTLPQLDDLYIDTKQTTVAAYEALGRAPSLRRLHVNSSSSGIGDPEVKALARSSTLEDFSVGVYPSMRVGEEGLEALAKAPAMRRLDLRGVRASEGAAGALRDAGVYFTRRGHGLWESVC